MFSSITRSSYCAVRKFSTENLKKTAFFDLHQQLGGKMVPFAGYELPVQYAGEHGGVLKEHLHTRADGSASLFDVSHMGQIKWFGRDRVRFIETLVCGDIAELTEGQARLSLILNENGGIVDDTVISNAGDHIYMVVNGATKNEDMQYFNQHLQQFRGDVHFEYLEDQQLVALQGPGASTVLSRLLSSSVDLSKVDFMSGFVTTVAGVDNCRVTRCGYTGEDGFEISVSNSNAVQLATILLDQSEVRPAGLGARDSLRLEAGLCLYGNDINETTNPVEASLVFTLGGPQSRRRKEQGFIGAQHFLTPDGKLKAVGRKRVGIQGMKAPARDHTEIFAVDNDQKKIGEITSGTFSPCLKQPIAMGYVETGYSKQGTPVLVKVRGKLQEAEIGKLPFFPTRYFRANL